MWAHPMFFLNWVLMKNALKVCRSVSRGGGEEVYHIPHTLLNSCREAGFSRVGRGCFTTSELGKFMQRGRVCRCVWGGGAFPKPGQIF